MSASKKLSTFVAARREARDELLWHHVRGSDYTPEEAVLRVYEFMFGDEADQVESGHVITPADKRDALAAAQAMVRIVEKKKKLKSQIEVLAANVRAQQSVVTATRKKAREHAQSRREKARIALVYAEEALQRLEDDYPSYSAGRHAPTFLDG